MGEQLHGHVTAVTRETHGDELTAAASIGDTVLQVIDTADFDETGGSLRLGSLIYAYTGIDDTAATITLESALTAAGAIADRVDVWDPDANNGAGDVVAEYVADIVDETTDDTIQATVNHALADRLEVAVRPGAGESVLCEVDDDGIWQVTEILGKTPVVDQASSSSKRVLLREGDAFFYGGLPDETPSKITGAGSTSLGRELLRLQSGTHPSYTRIAFFELGSGATTGTPGSGLGGAADNVGFSTYNGVVLSMDSNNTATFFAPDGVSIRDALGWTTPSPAGGFSAVSGQTPRWKVDAAGQMTIDGAVSLGGGVASGDRVWTFPTAVRRTALWRAPVRSSPFGVNYAEIEVQTNGEVRLYFTGSPTAIGLDTSFSIL